MAEGDEPTPIDQILSFINADAPHLSEFEKEDRQNALHALGRSYRTAIIENDTNAAEPDYSEARAIMEDYTPEDSTISRLFNQQELFAINSIIDIVDKAIHPSEKRNK